MLKEAIESLMAAGVKAGEPKLLQPKPEPGHVYYLQGQRVVATPAPRDHGAQDLATIVAFAEKGGEAEAGGGPVLWYNRKAVVCLLNDGERRDKVTLPLALSRPIEVLTNLQTPAALTQAAFIRLLRIDLAGACDSLVGIVRRVHWRSADEGEAELRPGKASVGRRIESELTGTAELPETVTLTVPVFTSILKKPFEVQCSLDSDAGTQSFYLVPLPNQVEEAIQEAEGDIGSLLRGMVSSRDLEVPVYYGEP